MNTTKKINLHLKIKHDEITESSEELSTESSEESSTESSEDEKIVVLKKAGKIQQDSMKIDDIQRNIKDHKMINNIKDMEMLTILPIGKINIKYINKKLNKFRVGGILIKIVYPRYIMLSNVFNKKNWCVNLDNSVLFIKNDIYNKYKSEFDKIQTEKKLKEEEEKNIENIKNKLYKLYISKKLK